ncbi:MAG TPA: orotate phosphoribosyltransferase [Chloroflexota bacterium]|nr:orotate phosphoribosyltransferase [Chloroflexota bacterium]
MEIQAQRARLNELIRERAVRHGDFVLRSGARSSFYLDCRQVTLHPEGAYLSAILILDRLRAMPIHAVGGPALAAVPIVGAVCALSFVQGRPLAGFVVRKEAKDHGTGNLIEGPLPPGSTVALVEDTLTTGGELLRAAAAVREQGCLVAGAICLIDRGAGALDTLHEHGIPAQALFSLADLGITATD